MNTSINALLEWKEVSRKCRQCGTAFTVRMLSDQPDHGPQFCDSCVTAKLVTREEEERSQLLARRLLRSGIPPCYDEYNPNKDRANISDRLEAESNMLIIGPYQCGKTHAVCHAGRQLVQLAQTNVRFMRCSEWLRRVAMLMGSDMEDAEDEINRAKRAELLIIDDLGKERLTERGAEILFELIDHREVEHLPTWITANLNPAELAERLGTDRGEAIMSRMRRAYVMVTQ